MNIDSKHILGGGALCAALVASILLGVAFKKDVRASVPAQERIHVATTAVQTGALHESRIEPGFLVSDRRIVITTRLSGYIDAVNVREGERIQQGDILVQLNAKDIDATIAQHTAALEAALIDVRDAERDIRHFTPMAEQGAIPRERIYKMHIRNKTARATRAQAEATLAAAKAQKTYATITSPLDGVVIAKHQSAGAMAAAGAPILTLDSSRNLLFRFYMAENRIGDMSHVEGVKFCIDALPGVELWGKIRSIIPSVDQSSRRFEVNIAVPEHPQLLPGMFGRAEIRLGVRHSLVVPTTALTQRGGMYGVFAVGKQGQLAFRWVRVGKEQEGSTEILAGLTQGETIVAQSDARMRDGMIAAPGAPHE